MPKPLGEGPKGKVSNSRRGPAPKDRDENGRIIGSETSKASRKRHCARITMASLQIDDENDDLSQFTPSFADNSHSHNTWGIPSSATTVAPKRKRKPASSKQLPGLGRNYAARNAGLFNRYPELCSPETTPEPVETSSPTRSPFLRYPLEVRERIYGYFLRSPNSILVNYDWEAVERCPDFVVKKILYICKQISAEALSFLYKNNTLHALLRENMSRLPAWSIPRITTTFLNLVKNVVLECPKENWDLEWYYKAKESIEALVVAKTVLKTFTIVLTPRQVGFTSTALGFEHAPITFADFLWEDGEVMKAIVKLSCKQSRIVVKKGDGRRLVLKTDIHGGILATTNDEENWFKEDKVYQLSRLSLQTSVKKEVAELKDKFEQIFHDEEKAVEMVQGDGFRRKISQQSSSAI
ncbi:uncharacterized protein EAF01_002498 [Botrytis porri]|uniref:uncharacterized protein n=1 Tax=Botrytis porri TaxID=87229 RepID=UPI0019011263|nr:uncharacterized protein EAF01_002498 [Botrytis porri]KAF7910990.1 hypothetical protein EAF01_002498 [Botrytis porri]